MEHVPWMLMGLGSVAVSAATWGVCRWWYGRQLAAAAQRVDKIDKARQFSNQQLMQARKQLEKLQREMAALPPRSVASPVSPPSRAAQVEAVLRSVAHIPPHPALPANGFADTQAMEPTT